MARKGGVTPSVLLMLAVVIGAGYWVLLRDPINPWAERRIRVGMTEPEVKTILGRPADRAHHPWDIAVFMPPAPGSSTEWEKAWVGSEWVILVHFDKAGKVLKSGYGDKDFDNPPPRTVSRQLWRLLGW